MAVAKKTGDGIIELQGKLQVTVDESAGAKAKKSIDKIIKDLERQPVKLAFDTKVAENFTRELDKIYRKQTELNSAEKAAKKEGIVAYNTELKLLEKQLKALEKVRDASLAVDRARKGYGASEQKRVAAGARLSDRDIVASAKTAKGRQKLGAVATASIARDELVGQSNKLARALFDAGMRDMATQVKREADRVASTGTGLSKRLSAGGLQKLSSTIQESNKQMADAAIKQAEKIQQDTTKAFLKAQKVNQRDAEAAAKKKSGILYSAEKALMQKSADDRKSEEAAARKRSGILYSAEKTVMQKEHADRRQAQLEQARALRVQSGKEAFQAAGGLGGFDPSYLTTKSGNKSVKAYLGSEVTRLSSAGDAEGVARHQKALDQLTNSHKKLNPVLKQTGALMMQFFRYAIGYQALYQALGAVTALTRGIVELDKSLFDIQAISQSTTKEMVVLSGAINDVAINSKFSTAEIAEATKVLAQAGVAASELPGALKSVADFGAATGSDLGVAADVLTTMQEVFSDLSSGQAADQLTKAVNVSKLTAQDLQTIASTGAQVAASYNISSEQLLAAASVLRNAGVKASTIATGTRQAMLEVFNPDKRSLEMLQARYQKMGEGLTQDQITAKYQGFTATDDPLLAAVTELKRIGFGTDPSLNRTFDVRAENVLHELIGSYEQLIELQSQFNFGQPAAEGAEIAMGSLAAQLDNLGSAMVALSSEMSKGVLDDLKDVVKWATSAIEKIREARNERLASGEERQKGFVETAAGYLAPTYLASKAYDAYQKANPNAEEQQQQRQSRLTGLAGQSATLNRELDALKAARAAFDPEGNEKLAADIARIREGLQGTEAQISQSQLRLNGFAESIKKQVVLMEDSMQTARAAGDVEKVKQLSEQFAQLNTLPVQEILNQQGEFADPEKALDGMLQMARVMREGAATLQEIGDKQTKAAELQDKIVELEVQNIISQQDETNMGAMVESFLISIDAMGVEAAERRLQVIREQVSAALAATDPTDTARVGALQGILKELDVSVQRIAEKKQTQVSGYVANLQSGAAQDPGRIEQFLASSAGKSLAQANPAAVEALRSGSAAQSVGNVTLGNGIEYGPDGKLQPQVGSAGPSAGVTGLAALAQWNQKDLAAQRKRELSTEVSPTKKTYVQDAEAFRKISELDFAIEKAKEFGGGNLVDLTQQRGALQMEEQRKAIAVAQQNVNEQGGDTERQQLAEEQIKLQKMELDARKDYIEAITKDTDEELKAYQERAKTVMEQGGDLTTLNTEFKASQQAAIDAITEWGKSVGMSDERIRAEIESRGILNQSLLSNKVVDDLIKSGDKKVDALAEAVPTSATTGNALLDAQSRVRGYGFTEAENADLYARQIAGKQQVIAGSQDVIAERQAALPFMEPEKREQAQATIDAYTKSIGDLNNEVNDLYVMMGDIGTTGADQLKQAFGEESIRPYLIALEQSQNALKNWGANLRGSVLSAWEGIGDAIADSVVYGENFGDMMEDLVKNLAGDILRTSAKGALNTLARSVLGSALPGTDAQAGQPGAAAGASPAAGGFLGSVASALGVTGAAQGAAGAATGSMTVTAGVVNVNGAAGAMEKTAKDMLGGGKEKGFFGSLFDGIGNMASDAWKGLKGAGSAVGDWASGAASSAGTWISSLFAADGWVGQFSNGYVDKNGIIRGPGTGTSDSISARMKFAKGKSAPIRISNKESILTEKATNYLGHDTIGALNAGKIPGFSAGRVADQSARATSGVNQDQMAPVVHVPEFPKQTLEAYVGINAAEVVAKGLRNNPGAVRELLEIQKVNRRAFTVQRN